MKIDIIPFVLYSNCKINAQSRLARARRLSFFRAARRDCPHLYNYCDKRGNLPMIKPILKPFTCMDLRQIADSGQCFRMTELSDVPGRFSVISQERYLEIEQLECDWKQTDETRFEAKTFAFYCKEEELSFWERYFDLDQDYEAYISSVRKRDSYLQHAAQAGSGIRILNQDPWEMILTQTFEVYGCADCSGCEHKAKCLYKYDAEKHSDRNKVMKINERWEELKEETNENIQSEEGILKRQTRSIQTEGHFGDIKENENFRRFHYRSKEKVYKEFMLYAIGRNIMKYHRFLHHEIEKYEGKKEQKTA